MCLYLLSLARSNPPVLLSRYLREQIQANLTGLTYLLPDRAPDEGLYVIDTAELFAALEGSADNNKRGLQQICRHLKIPVQYLHNAGNDAHVCVS